MCENINCRCPNSETFLCNQFGGGILRGLLENTENEENSFNFNCQYDFNDTQCSFKSGK